MRPVELVMQGFGPFRDQVTVDFADAELIAIVGATGHGKSSIIDAICFALYGRVPRHGDKDIAPVITLGTAEARVALTFTPSDVAWLLDDVEAEVVILRPDPGDRRVISGNGSGRSRTTAAMQRSGSRPPDRS